ncbi:cache domain-containing sensor histidine kinase [Sporanaerobium hydrogeniformans]|uniref:cache domain-containing sensor histidine kinase n=1 Tax=Sporanaerobium hydrogeniformans TaxID=3072179 RepID=UPI0015D4768A|nr:sensor histidine kinase [Sporanaerobium hydrogeniformans]
MIFTYFSLKLTKQTTLENSIKYMKELTEQMNYSIESYIKYMENISHMLNQNADVRNYLMLDAGTTEQKLAKKRVTEQIATTLNIREDIRNIAVIGINGRILLNNGVTINPYMNVREQSWYKKALDQKEGFAISTSHVQNIVEYEYPWVVTLSSAIQDKGGTSNIGVLLVDLNYKVIEDLCKRIELEDKGYIFIIDEAGNLVYHPNQKMIYSGLKTELITDVVKSKESYFITTKDNEEYLYTIAKSERTGWRAVGVVKTKALLTYSTIARNAYMVTISMLLVIAISLSIHLSKKITEPIRILEEAMKKSELGDFEAAEIEIVEKNEIGTLGKTFNNMNQKIHQLIKEKILAEKLKRKSELKALHAQINPHFLYNTLESIVWMSEGGKNKEVVKMTSELAKLLRQSISNGLELIPLYQEINYAKSYLSIQKMRYRDQLNYEIEVDPAIENVQIIKLIIQPLIENAIYHGIKNKETEGNILIKGYEKDEKIILEVEDDGIGMSEETRAHIFEEKETNLKKNGVGVYNVYSRLKLHYGQKAEMFCESELGKGTCMKITIVKEQEGEKA